MKPQLREELSNIFAEEISALRANDLLQRVKRPKTDCLELTSMRAWNTYAGAAEQLDAPILDTSTRAVQSRAILRIAQSYGWQSAIAHFLDMKGASYLADLTDPQLDDLHGRMLGYLDAAMSGCSSPDELPAT
jgi:hypothetical protein